MKKNWTNITIFLFIFPFSVSFSQKSIFLDDYRSKAPHIFRDEVLNYKISYGKEKKKGGILLAGHAELSLMSSKTRNDSFIINASGRTTRLFSVFFNISHVYQSLVNYYLEPVQFSMNIQQGNYSKQDLVSFNNDSLHIISKVDTIFNSAIINDMLSVFYLLRNLPHSEIEYVDTIKFQYYYNENIYSSHIINLGHELLRLKFGRIPTTKLLIKLEGGRYFRDSTYATLWVSNDEYHIPIKLELPVLRGSIYVKLLSKKNTHLTVFK